MKKEYGKNSTMDDKIIVYIDLGSSRISAIAGQVQEDNSVHIIGEQKMETNNVKNGIVAGFSGVAHKISQLLRYIQNAYHIQAIDCICLTVNAKSMQCVEYVSTLSPKGKVTDTMLQDNHKKAKEEIEAQQEGIVVFDHKAVAYQLDGEVKENPQGNYCRELQIAYNAVVGKKEIQDAIEKTIVRTGLKVDYVHLGIDAISTALVEEKDKKEGVALLSMGDTTTTLGVYSDGMLYDLLVVPLGGANITSDIQEVGISWEAAELLKTKKGSPMPLSNDEQDIAVRVPAQEVGEEPIVMRMSFLRTIIEARLEEILQPIFDTIDTLSFPLSGGIVLTGGAAKLNDIAPFIAQKTGLSVHYGSHIDWLDDTTEKQYEDIVYAQAVGAMLLTKQLQEENKQDTPVIKPVIPGWFRGVKDRIQEGLNSLFDYDMSEGVK